MNILLAVTGSVAATLTPKLYSELSKLGDVRIIITESAKHFVDFDMDYAIWDEDEWVAYSEHGKVLHIDLRDWAEVLVVAPCTANTLAKFANGLCDNLVTNVFRAWEECKPVIIAPAMNTEMWNKAITKQHLSSHGWAMVKPVEKELFCGQTGVGAMAKIEDIISTVKKHTKWDSPIKRKFEPYEAGKFGAVRKHDIHTGIDIYCEPRDAFYAVESGTLVASGQFTGTAIGSPWWNDTFYYMVEGPSGVVCYGEVWGNYKAIGAKIYKGMFLGYVEPVLKKPGPHGYTAMLHLELYKRGTRTPVTWHLNTEKPDCLLDPTLRLERAYA